MIKRLTPEKVVIPDNSKEDLRLLATSPQAFIKAGLNNISGKPCEDYYICDSENGIFILMDGCPRLIHSGEYPAPSPGLDAAGIFAESTHKELLTLLDCGTDPEEALNLAVSKGNEAVHFYNDQRFPNPDFHENDLAAALGIACLLHENTLYYIYAGDPFGFIVSEDKLKQFTISQTSGFPEVINELAAKGLTSQKDIQSVLYGELRNKNHPHGFAAFSGEPQVMDCVVSGKLKLSDGDRLILCSDGLERLIKEIPAALISHPADQLFNLAESLESDGKTRSDDKSIILVDLKLASSDSFSQDRNLFKSPEKARLQ